MSTRRQKLSHLKLLAVGAALAAFWASSAPAQPAVQEPFRLRVFIDCTVSGCDSDFFRTEIAFVDHVRDRADADVHVLVTTQATGGGGTVYTMAFIGRSVRAERTDTLSVSTLQTATPDERRKALSRGLKLGLVQYAAHTRAGEWLEITMRPKDSAGVASAAKSAHDPWNFWVFRIGSNSNFSGEKSQRFAYISGTASANRTTEAWKVSIRGNGSYNESKFTFSSGNKFANYSHTYGASELIVKSLGPHWSAGQRASIGSSTYLNQELSFRFAPAVEYNVFPYSESTRRQLTFQYSAGLSHYRYEEKTIFGKLRETHPDHSLTVSLDMKQPWGSISSSLEGAALIDDFSKKRMVNFTSLNLRLFKGFNLNMYSSVAIVRDQLYIPGGDLSDEEVLVRRRQLETSYRYFGGVGLSYTFGSIFNNVVNPRFGGSSGGIFIFE